MATFMTRSMRFIIGKQIRSSFRFFQKADIANTTPSHPRVYRLLRLVASGIAGTVGTGTSLAFLGFSFGAKNEEEDAEVDALTKSYRNARLAHQRQEFEQADELYHQALKLADDQLKKEEITKDKHLTARTLMYDGLADIALKTGQIERARTLYIETMKGCLQQGMATNDNVMIELSLKLASICAMVGKKEEAEEGYKFCIQGQSVKVEKMEKEWIETDTLASSVVDQKSDQLEDKQQDEAVLMGMALGSYGRFLLHEKRYQEALPYFERARLYALHTLGTDCNQYIVMLNDLATVHIVSKDYDKAEEVLKTGIIIAKKGKLQESAMLYCNLGAVYLRRGDKRGAQETCQRALETARQFNHTVAFRMAEACLKKCASIKDSS